MQPMLSVILPAHNEETTICKTVESLIKQDYASLEIVVVDDGSQDNTVLKIATAYGLQGVEQKMRHTLSLTTCKVNEIWFARHGDTPIFLLKKKHSGKADSLNAGINYCHGEYYICMDADCTLPPNSIRILAEQIGNGDNIAAIGGKVLPVGGINDFIKSDSAKIRDYLYGCQDLEYGMAFTIARPLLDRMDTSLLVSGAFGIFRKDLVAELGGYAVDTVGEDMELVFRIRRYAAVQRKYFGIRYEPHAECVTELPHSIKALKNQRIRWAIGLTEVLLKYRDMAVSGKYSLKQRITYWFYLLFEELTPCYEFICLMVGCFLHLWLIVAVMLLTPKLLELAITIAGSWRNLESTVNNSTKKSKALLGMILLLASYLTLYHYWLSMVRLKAILMYSIQKKKIRNLRVGWESPERENTNEFSK